MITDEGWAGAHLHEIAKLAAEPFVAGGRQKFEIEGPALTVTPRLAICLALTFHELATNAVKYGALSTPDGSVRIQWSVAGRGDEAALALEWRETNGPEVHAPARRGFGTRLIERSLSAEPGGAAELVFDREGLVCRLSADLGEEADAVIA